MLCSSEPFVHCRPKFMAAWVGYTEGRSGLPLLCDGEAKPPCAACAELSKARKQQLAARSQSIPLNTGGGASAESGSPGL